MHKNSFFNKLNLNINKQNNRGITLIALVITIIVLLILAGVSISMLTGSNGILTQAQSAKTTTDIKTAEEKAKLAVMAARAQSETGTLDADRLIQEITDSYGGVATKTGSGFPINASIDGKDFTINENGNVTSTERKSLSDITGNETNNTLAKDGLENPITIPAGFEVVNPNASVTDGIIIRDKTHTNTAGSEFVWIPVGDIKTENTGTVNIELNRYIFDENGKETKQGSNIIEKYWSEINTSTYGNITAKENIESEESGFRKSAKDNHGYYIGRYEARTNTQRTSKTPDDKLTQITTKTNDYVYNYVTQQQAATLSRKMYSGTPFESDLMNSYAWDTATLFLQTFDNRTIANKKVYSLQDSLNTGNLASQGTNKLNVNNQDIICNVWDMASNCWEWSTETFSNSDYPCTIRGGDYIYSDNYKGHRSNLTIPNGSPNGSFRPILYL